MSHVGDLLRDAATWADSHDGNVPDALLAALETYLEPAAALHSKVHAARNGHAEPKAPPSPAPPKAPSSANRRANLAEPPTTKQRDLKPGEGNEIRTTLKENRHLSFDDILILKKKIAAQRGLTLNQVSSCEAWSGGKLRTMREDKSKRDRIEAKAKAAPQIRKTTRLRSPAPRKAKK